MIEQVTAGIHCVNKLMMRRSQAFVNMFNFLMYSMDLCEIMHCICTNVIGII